MQYRWIWENLSSIMCMSSSSRRDMHMAACGAARSLRESSKRFLPAFAPDPRNGMDYRVGGNFFPKNGQTTEFPWAMHCLHDTASFQNCFSCADDRGRDERLLVVERYASWSMRVINMDSRFTCMSAQICAFETFKDQKAIDSSWLQLLPAAEYAGLSDGVCTSTTTVVMNNRCVSSAALALHEVNVGLSTYVTYESLLQMS